MLQWARRNGLPFPSDACALAVRAFKLRTLQWLRSVGVPWGEHPLRHPPAWW